MVQEVRTHFHIQQRRKNPIKDNPVVQRQYPHQYKKHVGHIVADFTKRHVYNAFKRKIGGKIINAKIVRATSKGNPQYNLPL